MVETSTFGHDWNIIFIKGKLTRNVELLGKQDPYMIFRTNGREYKSKTHDKAGKTPEWNQMFDVKISDVDTCEVDFECWDAGATSDTLIG